MKKITYVALCLTLASTAILGHATASPAETTVSANQSSSAGEGEKRRLMDWVAAHAPGHMPLGRDGSVRVEGAQLVSGRLPDEGRPGEEYTVENTLPDGTAQSWGFQWKAASAVHGDGWEMTRYTFRKGGGAPAIK
jgi:hypothetical protein